MAGTTGQWHALIDCCGQHPQASSEVPQLQRAQVQVTRTRLDAVELRLEELGRGQLEADQRHSGPDPAVSAEAVSAVAGQLEARIAGLSAELASYREDAQRERGAQKARLASASL